MKRTINVRSHYRRIRKGKKVPVRRHNKKISVKKKQSRIHSSFFKRYPSKKEQQKMSKEEKGLLSKEDIKMVADAISQLKATDKQLQKMVGQRVPLIDIPESKPDIDDTVNQSHIDQYKDIVGDFRNPHSYDEMKKIVDNKFGVNYTDAQRERVLNELMATQNELQNKQRQLRIGQGSREAEEGSTLHFLLKQQQQMLGATDAAKKLDEADEALADTYGKKKISDKLHKELVENLLNATTLTRTAHRLRDKGNENWKLVAEEAEEQQGMILGRLDDLETPDQRRARQEAQTQHEIRLDQQTKARNQLFKKMNEAEGILKRFGKNITDKEIEKYKDYGMEKKLMDLDVLSGIASPIIENQDLERVAKIQKAFTDRVKNKVIEQELEKANISSVPPQVRIADPRSLPAELKLQLQTLASLPKRDRRGETAESLMQKYARKNNILWQGMTLEQREKATRDMTKEDRAEFKKFQTQVKKLVTPSQVEEALRKKRVSTGRELAKLKKNIAEGKQALGVLGESVKGERKKAKKEILAQKTIVKPVRLTIGSSENNERERALYVGKQLQKTPNFQGLSIDQRMDQFQAWMENDIIRKRYNLDRANREDFIWAMKNLRPWIGENLPKDQLASEQEQIKVTKKKKKKKAQR